MPMSGYKRPSLHFQIATLAGLIVLACMWFFMEMYVTRPPPSRTDLLLKAGFLTAAVIFAAVAMAVEFLMRSRKKSPPAPHPSVLASPTGPGTPWIRNGDQLIRVRSGQSLDAYKQAFWEWIAILARRDYVRALESLYWPKYAVGHTPESLEWTITTFYGADKPWVAVVPNDRLVTVVNDAFEHKFLPTGGGWFRAQIPVTFKPENPLDDAIPLGGIAASFEVVERNGEWLLCFELFYV